MRAYELTFIVRPDVSEDDLSATIDQVQNWLTSQGNSVSRVDRWGRRRLAYPINNQREGHYIRVEASIAPETIHELERNLKLHDAILRYLLVREDSK